LELELFIVSGVFCSVDFCSDPVNTALEEIRKNKHQLLTDSIDDVDVTDEGELTDSLNAKDLILIIQKLPQGYQLIFNLYAIEGYSHKEIADLLKISEGTSKSQLSKARAYLQKLIKETQIVKEQHQNQ